MLLSFVYELYLSYTYSYPKLHMLSNAIPPTGEKFITTGLLSVYCMKGKIFCGLASLFLDFKGRVQALCCICHHVASLHDRQFFSRYSGEGRHSQSEWRARDMPDTRLPPSCGAGAPHSLHTCLCLPNKCLLCRPVIKIPRHIPLMQARPILPLRRKAEQCVCVWVCDCSYLFFSQLKFFHLLFQIPRKFFTFPGKIWRAKFNSCALCKNNLCVIIHFQGLHLEF